MLDGTAVKVLASEFLVTQYWHQFWVTSSNSCCIFLQGLLPGMFGVSHGALQFMAYEELKKLYNSYHNDVLNKKLVILFATSHTD